SMCVSAASFSSAASSSSAILRCSAFKARARYIAPLSRYVYPSTLAIRRATLLFPEPAGPSMAIVSFGMKCRSALFPFPTTSGAHGNVRVRFAAPTLNCELATVNLLEPHDVVAAIDVNRFPGNSRTAVGQQERTGGTHLRGINISLQRRALGVRFQHLPQAG